MDLTIKQLASFIEGQIQIKNFNERCIYRGEIATIEVVRTEGDTTLVFTFRWLAKTEDFDSKNPTGWVNETLFDFTAFQPFYKVDDVFGDRLHFFSLIMGNFIVLFPKGDDPLDPAEVKGLEIAA